MPLTALDADELQQACLACGAEHTIPLSTGLSKSKKEPYVLSDGDTLLVKIDDETEAQTITFADGDFQDIGSAKAAEIVAKIDAALVGGSASVDANAVRIVSLSSAMGTTSVEISGGTAYRKLGFDGRKRGPLVLGVSKGEGSFKQTAVDTIDLPHCPDCGAKECLVRTWDETPPGLENTFHGRHRRAVNALAQHLRATGFSDPDAQTIHDGELGPPPDIEPGFPVHGLTLPWPPMNTPDPGDP